MMSPREFRGLFRRNELRLLASLKVPSQIQSFLDELPYSADDFNRCPRRVLADGTGNCFDGAVLAAAALRLQGHPARIVDLFAHDDDDHVLAVFQVDGRWGAIGKSNFVGLRYREPVYRTLRELVMSYFEFYYNVAWRKTLRSYTRPIDLRAFDRLRWPVEDAALNVIAERTERVARIPLLTAAMIRGLSRVDERTYRSGLIDAVPGGLYRPADAAP